MPTSQISPNAGLFSNQGTAQNNIDPVIPNIPVTSYDDPNWVNMGIQEALWNESYPYQLVMMQQVGTGYQAINSASFTLPIPPESLNRDMVFAIKLNATVGGIVEQHNAAPIRALNITGTTGLLPLRGLGTPNPVRSFAQALFGGVLIANTLLQSSALPNVSPPNLITTPEIPIRSTGYYQFLMLQRFLEVYATIKKSVAGRNVVLAFAIFKEQAYYLVTPRRFTLSRSAAAPMMWNYSLSMDTWGRVNPTDGGAVAVPNVSIYQDPSELQNLLDNLTNAQADIYKNLAVIQGFQGDVTSLLLEPLRQTVLFVKNTIGSVIYASDLPINIQTSLKTSILEAAGGTNPYGNGLGNLTTTTDAELQVAYQQVVQFSTITNLANTQASILAESASVVQNSAIPGNTILNNPAENFSFFAQIQPSQLTLSPQIQTSIQNELNTINNLTRTDFANYRDTIQVFMDNYADSVGAGSADYNVLYGRPVYVQTSQVPSSQEWQVLGDINNVLIELNKLAATATTDAVLPNPMTYVAALAGPFGIPFQIPNSKYAVPFPYNFTLEQVAARYLGDANRWIEIATLNNLAAPYVDEVGFTVPLLVPGSGYTIEVATDVNLYVNQTVYISSNTQLRKRASITAITPVGTNFVITLNIDGLELFVPADGAEISTYLPNTVNSQQLIYLPSRNPATESDYLGPPNPALADFQNQLAIGGVDLLLTGNGDLAITSNGDCRLAIGLANLIQRVRLAIDTPVGSLLQHPDYGFPTIVGQSNADLTAQQILNNAKSLFRNDPAFTGVISASVVQNGPGVNLQMIVGLAGTDQQLPVTFEVPTQGV